MRPRAAPHTQAAEQQPRVSQQSEQSERAREREREARAAARSRQREQPSAQAIERIEREREGEERAFSTSPTPPRDPNHCLPAPPCHTLPYRPFTVPPRPHSRAHARLYPPVLPHHVVLPHHRRVCKTTALHATRTATARRTTIATTAQCAWVACVYGVFVLRHASRGTTGLFSASRPVPLIVAGT
jgi:hypothetical protein